MKRLLTILFFLLAVVTVVVSVSAGGALPSDDGKTLYERYASRDGLTVAQIEGFRLNDTVKVDVVIVVADTDAEWQKLCKEFDIRSDSGVSTWTGNGNHPETRIRWQGGHCCKVIASPAKRTISMYHITNETDYESLMDYQMKLMMES
jgi:hypothetical protein